MKPKALTLITLLTFAIAIGTNAQRRTSAFFIPKDDASQWEGPLRHMKTAKQNMLAREDERGKIIRIWTNNGIIDSCKDDMYDYCVIPTHDGKVNVYTLQAYGKNFTDTIETIDSFIAITMPEVSIQILHDDFRKNGTIKFAFINNKTKKPLSNQYTCGRFFEPNVYNKEGKYIGDLILCFGNTLYFREKIHRDLHVKSGYKIRLLVTLRDQKTDLLFATSELWYTIK